MEETTRFQLLPGIISKAVSPDTVFVANYNGKVIILRGTSKLIWEIISSRANNSFTEIMAALMMKSSGPTRQLPNTLEQALKVLIHNGMITPVHLKAPLRDELRMQSAISKGDQDVLVNVCKSLGIPIRVIMNLTYYCNLRCGHCYAQATMKNGRRRPNDWLDIEDYLRIIDEMNGCGIFLVRLSGGEPLLYPHFERLLKALNDNNFYVTIVTNGTLITDEVGSILQAYGVRSIAVSFHGSSAETHDAFTEKRGSFNRAVAGVHRLLSVGLPVTLSFVVSNRNLNEVTDMVALSRDLGVRLDISPFIVPTSEGGLAPIPYRMDREQVDMFLRTSGYKPSKLECNIGWKAVIDPDGTVFPCHMVRRSVGQLRSESFLDIWKGSSLDGWRQSEIFRSPGHKCSACTFSTFCHRCPAVALYETGRPDYPDIQACQIAHAFGSSNHYRGGSLNGSGPVETER